VGVLTTFTGGRVLAGHLPAAGSTATTGGSLSVSASLTRAAAAGFIELSRALPYSDKARISDEELLLRLVPAEQALQLEAASALAAAASAAAEREKPLDCTETDDEDGIKQVDSTAPAKLAPLGAYRVKEKGVKIL